MYFPGTALKQVVLRGQVLFSYYRAEKVKITSKPVFFFPLFLSCLFYVQERRAYLWLGLGRNLVIGDME